MLPSLCKYMPACTLAYSTCVDSILYILFVLYVLLRCLGVRVRIRLVVCVCVAHTHTTHTHTQATINAGYTYDAL